MKRLMILAAICLAACSVPPAENTGVAEEPTTTCVDLQRTGTSGVVQDSEVWSNLSTTALGAGSTTKLYLIDGPASVMPPPTRYGLVAFDLSSIPSGASVTSATMTLTNENVASGTPEVHDITAAWAESTVTYTSFASAFNATVVDSSTNSGAIGTTWSANITSSVSAWVSGSRASAWNGVLIKQPTGSSGFYSSETTTVSNRPLLHVCYSTGATCTDGIQNQGESDIDCGGSTSCARCTDGKACSAGSDCSSSSCSGGVCVSCSDGVKNGTETDVDCGGTCATCANGKACTTNGDCTSGNCSGGICAVPGSCSPSCANGQACTTNGDCASGLCYGGLCYAQGGASISPVSSCTLPSDTGAWTVSTIAYKSDGAGGSLSADVYIPTGTKTGRVIVVAHPGGYTALDRTWFFLGTSAPPSWSGALASRGDIVVSIDYRLATTGGANVFPAAQIDGRCAMRWVQAHASGWGGNQNRIGCVGFSAGGHLCAYVAATAGLTSVVDSYTMSTLPLDDGTCVDPATSTTYSWSSSDASIIKRVVAWYSPFDLRTQPGTWPPQFLGESSSNPDYTALAYAASPNPYFSPNMPPMLLEGGTSDTTVPISFDTAAVSDANALGANATLISVTGGVHFASPLWNTMMGANYTTASCTTDSFLGGL